MRDVGLLTKDIFTVEDPTLCPVKLCEFCQGYPTPQHVKLFAGYRISVIQNLTSGYPLETVCFKCIDQNDTIHQVEWQVQQMPEYCSVASIIRTQNELVLNYDLMTGNKQINLKDFFASDNKNCSISQIKLKNMDEDESIFSLNQITQDGF